jgi:hypothetical protein
MGHGGNILPHRAGLDGARSRAGKRRPASTELGSMVGERSRASLAAAEAPFAGNPAQPGRALRNLTVRGRTQP